MMLKLEYLAFLLNVTRKFIKEEAARNTTRSNL